MITIKNFGIVAFGIATLGLTSCTTTKSTFSDGHNAQNSLDYAGTYYAVLPCADCSGIGTKVALNMDNTYTLEQSYLGKSDASFTERGSYAWNKEGNSINFKPTVKDGQTLKFFVSENKIIMLDQEGKKITGPLKDYYILSKDYADLINKKWLLKEMYGKPYIKPQMTQKEAYIFFDEKTGQFNANAGCNQMMGGFEITEEHKMTFEKVASTMMACQDMQAEQTLSQVLKSTSYFDVQNDQLLLLDSNQKPIASFQDSTKK